jgi:hypothetical protein
MTKYGVLNNRSTLGGQFGILTHESTMENKEEEEEEEEEEEREREREREIEK